MMNRKRAVEIAAKLPLADLLSTLDQVYADYSRALPSAWQSSTRQMSSRVVTAIGECRCALGKLAADRSTAVRLDVLMAENDRLRRTISSLTHKRSVP